jgi:hypothetical protein
MEQSTSTWVKDVTDREASAEATKASSEGAGLERAWVRADRADGIASGFLDRALVEEVAGLEVKGGVEFDGLPRE